VWDHGKKKILVEKENQMTRNEEKVHTIKRHSTIFTELEMWGPEKSPKGGKLRPPEAFP